MNGLTKRSDGPLESIWNTLRTGVGSLFSEGSTPSTQPTLSPVHETMLADHDRREAIKNILATLGVAGAAGVGIRGAMGIGNFFGRPTSDTTRSPGPSVLQIPVPVYTNRRDEERARRLKTAAKTQYTISEWEIDPREYPELSSVLSDPGHPHHRRVGEILIGMKNRGMLGRPHRVTEKQAGPDMWAIPGIVAAGTGGLYGGYKLMDWLMKKKRKSDLEAEIAAARDRYHQALISQYNPAAVPSADQVPVLKAASLLKDLQKAAETMEKVACGLTKTATPTETVLGSLITLAGLLAAGSGAATYHWTKSRSTNKLLEDAIKQRERERYARRPPEIYAVPQPVHLTRGGELRTSGSLPDLESSSLLGG